MTVDVFAHNSIMSTGLTVSARETRVLGQLGNQRNTTTVLDHWEDAGTAVKVSRYPSGGSLHERIVARYRLAPLCRRIRANHKRVHAP